MINNSLEFNQGTGEVILHAGSDRFSLPSLWLRERCSSNLLVDAATGQRLFNPHQLPDDLEVVKLQRRTATSYRLKFSDNVEDNFDLNQLLSELYSDKTIPQPVLWQSDLDMPVFDWSRLDENEYKLQSLEAFFHTGFILLQNTPTQKDSVLQIARQYGYVRTTNFGEYFEVYSRANANDLAYTSHALAAHTDNPYRDPVPGIQILHCLINDNPDGLSTLVDGFSICQKLKQEDPEGFDLLCRVSVRFQFTEEEYHIIDSHPLIDTNENGEVIGIHYSPRLDYMPLMTSERTRAYQRARKRLGELFADAQFKISFPLEKGEVIIFDNNRVLHGRTSFDPAKGDRHLQGCYIDRDGPKSIYINLSKKLLHKA